VRAIVASGFGDIKQANDELNKYHTAKFPFLAKEKKRSDEDMVERMKKEVAKGPISFQAMDPLRKAAKRVRDLPDRYKEMIERSARKR